MLVYLNSPFEEIGIIFLRNVDAFQCDIIIKSSHQLQLFANNHPFVIVQSPKWKIIIKLCFFKPEYDQETLNKRLHEGIRHGSLKRVNGILDMGADVNARDSEGRTPAFKACDYPGDPLLLTALISKGADVVLCFDR